MTALTLEDAYAHVIDGARQHRDSMIADGRIDGAAALLTEAIAIVEQDQQEKS